MAQEARLMLGPRDGEVVSIVEPRPEIKIMLAPPEVGHGKHKEVPDEEAPDYDVAVYTLGPHLAPGVFQYNYDHTEMGEERT